MLNNILLKKDIESFEVDFKKISPNMFIEAYDFLINEFEKEFKLTLNLKKVNYEDLFCSKTYDKLMSIFHLMGSLNTLTENEKLRKIEEKYSAILSVKSTEWSLNNKMFKKIEKFSKTKDYLELSNQRQKMITKSIKDYKKSGVNLPQKQKKILAQINKKLSILSQKFQNNITDSQNELSFIINKNNLKGLPDRSIKNIEELSKLHNLREGKFYIDETSGLVGDVMKFSDNENIRKKIYFKYRELCTKGKFNNSEIINKIYKLKQDLSILLGYKDFAHMTLEENMAKLPQTALEFLENLGNIAMPYAKKESILVSKFGEEILGRKMEWWDTEYVINHMMKNKFDYDSEKIREYFPVKKVVYGLFNLCKNLFGVDFIENKNKNTWNEDVQYFEVYEKNEHIGGIFLDLYKRNGKTPGAWLDPICSYENNNLKKTKPVALLVCNAHKDTGQVATFELEDVINLFHEMGHGLHHLLSKVEENFFSGFNNVEHDAIEIPSQLMEYFVYDTNVLKNISENIITGEIISDELIKKIQNVKRFLGANVIVKYVRYSEMDINLYLQKDLHPYEIESCSMEKWKVKEDYDKLQRRMAIFSHIFGGGYASGYYAYQWAEVYAADGFNYLNEGTKEEKQLKLQKYKEEILYTGGKRSMSESYALFKPEKVDLNNLIKNYIEE